MTSRAIWAAYRDTGTIDIPCPRCGANSGTWCTRNDGRVRRVPCVDRLAAASGSVPDARDFSEPLHPQKVRGHSPTLLAAEANDG